MITLRKKPSSPTAEKSLHVVIADDVHEIVQLIKGWLEEQGHTVTCASNGREVMRLIREKPFDILITDIVMPEADGWDAILAVNRLRPAARILAISGGGSNMPADACLRVAKGVGADRILKKPFNRAQLISVFQEISRR